MPHPWLNLSSVLYVVSVIVCCSFTRVGMTVRSARPRACSSSGCGYLGVDVIPVNFYVLLKLVRIGSKAQGALDSLDECWNAVGREQREVTRPALRSALALHCFTMPNTPPHGTSSTAPRSFYRRASGKPTQLYMQCPTLYPVVVALKTCSTVLWSHMHRKLFVD